MGRGRWSLKKGAGAEARTEVDQGCMVEGAKRGHMYFKCDVGSRNLWPYTSMCPLGSGSQFCL